MKLKLLGISALLAASIVTFPAFSSTAWAAETNDTNVAVTAEEQTKQGKGGHRHGKEAAEPETAIGKDAAKAAALSDAGLTTEQVEKVKARYSTKDETSAYHVFFKYEDTVYSYKVDAENGTILDKKTGSTEELKDNVKGKKGGKGSKAGKAGGKKGERQSDSSGSTETTDNSTVA